MKNNCTLREIAEVIRTNNTFVVMSHVRPDGDALGCQLAMAICLRQAGKKVKVWNQDGMLDKYRFLPYSELVTLPPDKPELFDVAFALDTATHERLGKNCLQAIERANVLVNIDHHISNNGYGDLAYIDSTAPATGQILYELIRGEGLPFTYEIADNLFVAISTDTGSFQYPSTSARSFEIAGELIKAGVDVGKISQQIYENYPRRRIELLRALLNVLKVSCNGRVASFCLTTEMARQTGARPEDNEGLIDYIRAIEGVVVAVFIEEISDGKVRLSMRSKDPKINVSKICGQFGGGGHVLAAGAAVSGDLASVQEKVLNTIYDEFDQP